MPKELTMNLQVDEGFEGVTYEQGQAILEKLDAIISFQSDLTIMLSIMVGCLLGIAFAKGLGRH